MAKHEGSTMELSGERDSRGVPKEIIEMREAQRAAAREAQAEKLKKLEEDTGEHRIVSPDKRNIR